MLFRSLAVTTGEGRERYSEAALDDAALFVEMARIPILGKFQQLVNRTEAEVADLPPSAYHIRRKARHGIPPPRSSRLNPPAMSAGEFAKFTHSVAGPHTSTCTASPSCR